MKMFIMVAAFLCLAQVCFAQSARPLKVGDRFPEMVFTNVINAPYSSVSYSKLKDKVVVLDFFSTWCSSCLALFPHLDSLKAKYGERLEIFIVTREPREKVEKMLKTKAIAKGFKLPFIVEDTVLCKLFPNKYLPHEILIKGGTVAAITYPGFLNDSSISILLKENEIDLPVKKDRVHYDFDQSLIKNLEVNSTEIGMGQFFLSKAIAGVPAMGYVRESKDKSFTRYTKVNRTLLELLVKAAGFLNVDNRIVLEVKDSSKFVTTNALAYAWRTANTYCLEYIVPTAWSDNKIGRWLLQQFSIFTDYDLSVESRLMDCWVLTKASKTDTSELRSHEGLLYRSVEGMVASMNNQLFGNLIVPIVLDETRDSSTVHINLKREDIHNPIVLSGVLRKYGYELKPAKRRIRILIIRDKLKPNITAY